MLLSQKKKTNVEGKFSVKSTERLMKIRQKRRVICNGKSSVIYSRPMHSKNFYFILKKPNKDVLYSVLTEMSRNFLNS